MKDFSIVIPIYNEEKLLQQEVERIVVRIKKLKLPVKFEILLIENGSVDKSGLIAKQLSRKFKQVKYFHLQDASYGQAFKHGIKMSKYDYIFQFDIDFWDVKFIAKSQNLLDNFDFVIGSKNLKASNDNRSAFRKTVSRLMEKIIELRFNTQLTDTHGLKALKKSIVSGLIEEIKCDNHFLDSELLLRATKYGFTFAELPVSLHELRQSRFPFYLRFFEAISEFMLLISININTKKILTTNYKLQTTN